MFHTIAIAPGITLRCFPDERFKQACMSIQLLRPVSAQEAGLNALLPSVLLRGCESAPDIRAIARRTDDLYGTSIGGCVRRVGDWQTTGLSCGFVEDRFALSGDRIMEPVTALLQDGLAVLHSQNVIGLRHQFPVDAHSRQGRLAGSGEGKSFVQLCAQKFRKILPHGIYKILFTYFKKLCYSLHYTLTLSYVLLSC